MFRDNEKYATYSSLRLVIAYSVMYSSRLMIYLLIDAVRMLFLRSSLERGEHSHVCGSGFQGWTITSTVLAAAQGILSALKLAKLYPLITHSKNNRNLSSDRFRVELRS